MVAVDAVISALVTLIVTPVPSDTVTLPTADVISDSVTGTIVPANAVTVPCLSLIHI